MGIWGDIENAAGAVVRAGEEAAGMLNSLGGFLVGAGLGNVVHELAQLAEETNRLRQWLASAVSATDWKGAAASAFHERARQRQTQIAELVEALDSTHSAVSVAYAMAGI